MTVAIQQFSVYNFNKFTVSECYFSFIPMLLDYCWAPSTRIRIFLNPQLFPPDSKISSPTRSVIKSNSPVHTHPKVSIFTPAPRAPQRMRHKACDSGDNFALLCSHVGLKFGKRLDTNFLRQLRIREYPDLPFHT